MKTVPTEEYKLIPMDEITDEARKMAVLWMECEDKDWIGQKHKLASDIMNYANKQNKELKKELEHYKGLWKQGCEIIDVMEQQNKSLNK